MNSPAFRRPGLLVVTVVAALSLSACSPLDVFGPRPDADLLELAQKATADAQRQDGPVAQVRAAHADELYAEIARLCGRDEEGQVPDSCTVEVGDGGEQPSPTRLGTYLTAADEVPDESRDLVVDQAIDLAAFDATDLEETEFAEITAPEDLALLRDLLEREHGAVYALEAARAFSSDPGAVDALVDDHQAAVTLLSELLTDAPVAAPGYTFGDAELGDEFIASIERSTAQAWRAAAADATTLEARSFLIAGAGRAAHREMSGPPV